MCSVFLLGFPHPVGGRGAVVGQVLQHAAGRHHGQLTVQRLCPLPTVVCVLVFVALFVLVLFLILLLLFALFVAALVLVQLEEGGDRSGVVYNRLNALTLENMVLCLFESNKRQNNQQFNTKTINRLS